MAKRSVQFVFLLMLASLSSCTAVAVVDGVVSTAVGVSKVAVKGAVTAADMAIPDADDEENSEEESTD